MKLTNRLTGRIGAAAVLAAVLTCGGVALAPAALAAPTVASATTLSTAPSATHSAAVNPRTAGECIEYYEAWGYRNTTARATACHIAALGRPNPHTAIVACIASLTISGVGGVVATVACNIGAAGG
jgi:hypothetical protein